MAANRNSDVWTDPATGVVYDAATMEPLPTVGDDLGELSGSTQRPQDLPTADEIDGFAALLGLDPEED